MLPFSPLKKNGDDRQPAPVTLSHDDSQAQSDALPPIEASGLDDPAPAGLLPPIWADSFQCDLIMFHRVTLYTGMIFARASATNPAKAPVNSGRPLRATGLLPPSRKIVALRGVGVFGFQSIGHTRPKPSRNLVCGSSLFEHSNNKWCARFATPPPAPSTVPHSGQVSLIVAGNHPLLWATLVVQTEPVRILWSHEYPNVSPGDLRAYALTLALSSMKLLSRYFCMLFVASTSKYFSVSFCLANWPTSVARQLPGSSAGICRAGKGTDPMPTPCRLFSRAC